MLNAIKWLATAGIVVATAARAFDLHNVDMVFGTIGTALWLWASIKMRETPLVIVNVVCLAFLIFGLTKGLI